MTDGAVSASIPRAPVRRDPFDLLRRGLENTLANWPLLLFRILEWVVAIALLVGAVMVVIVPMILATDLGDININSPASAVEWFIRFVSEQWMIPVYAMLIVFAVIGVMLAVHSFIVAGSARVYLDADRLSDAQATQGFVARFRLPNFMESWTAGARERWWTVFWIYNLAWSVAALIVLLPLLAIIALMLSVEEPGVIVALGCGGILLALILGIVLGILTHIWTVKAIVVCVERRTGASESLRLARRELGRDFGRHLVVVLLLFVIAIGGSMVLSTFSAGFSGFTMPDASDPGAMLSATVDSLFAPVQLFFSLISTAFSVMVSGWWVAAFAAFATEQQR